MTTDDDQEPEWRKKQKEYEIKKARAKAMKLRLTCSICSAKAKLNCPCGTTQYCSTECQRIDWRDRGHRKACKKIRDERAAEAARAEAPTPPPSPPEEVVYGPAPRSQADEIRARIAAEHEAARLRREANPEPEPLLARWGARCPICFEDWDINEPPLFRPCCCRHICKSCEDKLPLADPCPLCRTPAPRDDAEQLARLRRHVENNDPQAMVSLALAYFNGEIGLAKSAKKSAKIYKRAAELGNSDAMYELGCMYFHGDGVKRNWKKAAEMYHCAGERGDPTAQWHLSDMLNRNGQVVEARRWCRLAAAQNFEDAVDEAARLETKPEPPVGVKLRFSLLARVECWVGNVGDEKAWEPGEIVHLWWHMPDFLDTDYWPADFLAPYQIKLDSGRLIYASQDDDSCIRRPRSG
jgi:hypothetical protein